MAVVRAGSQNLSLSRHALSTPHSHHSIEFSKNPGQTVPGQHLHQTHGAKRDHKNAAGGTRHLCPPTHTEQQADTTPGASDGEGWGHQAPHVRVCVSAAAGQGEARRSGCSWVCLWLPC